MSRVYGTIRFSGLWNGLPVRIVMIGNVDVPPAVAMLILCPARDAHGFPMACVCLDSPYLSELVY